MTAQTLLRFIAVGVLLLGGATAYSFSPVAGSALLAGSAGLLLVAYKL